MNEKIKTAFSIKTLKILRFLIFAVVFSAFLFSFYSTANCMTQIRQTEVKTKIQKILSSKEFNPVAKQKGKSLTEIISEAVRNFWNWLTGKVSKQMKNIKVPDNNIKVNNNLGYILMIVLKAFCAVLILAFITAIIFFLLMKFGSSKRIRRKKDAILLSSIRDPNTTERKALEYADKGEFRQALRYLYISMLLKLNEVNIIKIDRSKTNKQYLSEMNISGYNKYDMALKFTNEFNRCWYGNMNVKKDIFDYWYGSYNALVGEVGK